jgi:hypothetical protein
MGNRDIDIQVSELLDYCVDTLELPISYWRNDSEQGKAARARERAFDTTGYGDVRRYAVLKIIRAMYGKTKCSFVRPILLYEAEDTFYFPEGAAFCKQNKPNGFMAAHALTINPSYRMMQEIRTKGETYMRTGSGRALTNAPSASSAASSRSAPPPKASASSASSSRTMPPPKAPAMKRPAGQR